MTSRAKTSTLENPSYSLNTVSGGSPIGGSKSVTRRRSRAITIGVIQPNRQASLGRKAPTLLSIINQHIKEKFAIQSAKVEVKPIIDDAQTIDPHHQSLCGAPTHLFVFRSIALTWFMVDIIINGVISFHLDGGAGEIETVVRSFR
jgi:hypothetical protein